MSVNTPVKENVTEEISKQGFSSQSLVTPRDVLREAYQLAKGGANESAYLFIEIYDRMIGNGMRL